MFSSVWVLRMGFADGFCGWVLRMGFAYEFSSLLSRDHYIDLACSAS
jgi:hypothetical protein